MIWKLLMVAEQRFKKLGGQVELAAVYEGAKFVEVKVPCVGHLIGIWDYRPPSNARV